MAALLSEAEIETRLRGLARWSREGKAIRRELEFANFVDAMAFVQRIALVSEKRNHHPDITINYNRVILSLFTHSEGGLTARDFDDAAAFDDLAG